MPTTEDHQSLIAAIGESVLRAFPGGTFRSICATLDSDSGAVELDMDLRVNTRTTRHAVIEQISDNVLPLFRPDDVAFTFLFSEHAGERAAAGARTHQFAVA